MDDREASDDNHDYGRRASGRCKRRRAVLDDDSDLDLEECGGTTKDRSVFRLQSVAHLQARTKHHLQERWYRIMARDHFTDGDRLYDTAVYKRQKPAEVRIHTNADGRLFGCSRRFS
jgi:hypothetical protein